MNDERISLKERRKVRRAARREGYDVVRNCRTLEEALALGERRMRANYGSGLVATIAIQFILMVIKYLWEHRDRDGALPALPPDWETRFDRS